MNSYAYAMQDAIDMAAFLRRQAHSRLKMQRALFPEWNNTPNHITDAARYDLKQAIRWIQIAKHRKEQLECLSN